jgi:hypothetical protein
MPPVRQLAALAAALVAVATGCDQPTQADPSRSATELPPCNPEQGRPISEARLKTVLAQRSIHLYRDDRCETYRNPEAPPPDPNAPPRTPNAPQATLRNSRDSVEGGRVFSKQGDIFCDVYKKDRVGAKLERIKYEGDQETHLSALNISCTIYPDAPAQIDALAEALAHLPGVKK